MTLADDVFIDVASIDDGSPMPPSALDATCSGEAAPTGLVRRPPAVLFGVGVDNVDLTDTIAVIEALAADGRDSGRNHQVATVNVDFLVNAFRDEENRRILRRSALCLPDGMPIVWAARSAGMPLQCRVAGADLVPKLVERSQESGLRVHFIGGAPGVVERAVERLRLLYPRSIVTGQPLPDLQDVRELDPSVLASIRAVDADVIGVALGNPKQEYFIDVHRAAIGAPVMIGIGGSLDMVVEDKRRAPAWAQRAGLEWAFRAAQEPARLGRRYLRDGVVFGPRVLAYLRLVRRYRNAADVTIRLRPGLVEVSCSPDGADESEQSWHDAALAVIAGARMHVDTGAVRSLSLSSISKVLGLLRLARAHGATCTVHSAAGVHQQLEELGDPFDLQGAGGTGTGRARRPRQERVSTFAPASQPAA